MIDPIDELVSEYPRVKHFFICCKFLGVLQLMKKRPSADRRKNKGSLGRRWSRYADKLKNTVLQGNVANAIEMINDSPMPGIEYSDSTEDAKIIVDSFINTSSVSILGFHDEVLTEDTAIVFLFKD